MASALDENNNKKSEIKITAATIMIVVSVGVSFACISIFFGSTNLTLSDNRWIRIAGILSIINGLVKLLDVVKSIKKIINKDSFNEPDKNSRFVKNILYLVMSVCLFISGIVSMNLDAGGMMNKMGIIPIVVGSIDMVNSFCTLICPILSKDQVESNLCEGDVIYVQKPKEVKYSINTIDKNMTRRNDQCVLQRENKIQGEKKVTREISQM